jgi:hypothetical protein
VIAVPRGEGGEGGEGRREQGEVGEGGEEERGGQQSEGRRDHTSKKKVLKTPKFPQSPL